jgi:hypothetical protein
MGYALVPLLRSCLEQRPAGVVMRAEGPQTAPTRRDENKRRVPPLQNRRSAGFHPSPQGISGAYTAAVAFAASASTDPGNGRARPRSRALTDQSSLARARGDQPESSSELGVCGGSHYRRHLPKKVREPVSLGRSEGKIPMNLRPNVVALRHANRKVRLTNARGARASTCCLPTGAKQKRPFFAGTRTVRSSHINPL